MKVHTNQNTHENTRKNTHQRTVTMRASGRVNLIGEHTDYNGGFVLPTAISQETVVELKLNPDSKLVRAESSNTGKRFECALGSEKLTHSWSDYIQGVVRILSSVRTIPCGFDIKIDSHVPMGSGLSSSAALEVALFRALNEAFDFGLQDVEIARLCQRVENEFVGARVGIMDPMACSLARPGSALFLDTRDLSYRVVDLPKELDLIVISSGISHRNVGGGYNERRAQCETACRELGINELRDLSVSDLPKLDRLSDVLKRRARHVITENERVVQAVKAIEERDLPRLGHLFKESHLSMKLDYETSIPEIDLLVELTNSEPDVYGARLTGGGFGGSIVAIAKKGKGSTVSLRVTERYQKETGEQPRILT